MTSVHVRSRNIDDRRPTTDLTVWKISNGYNYLCKAQSTLSQKSETVPLFCDSVDRL